MSRSGRDGQHGRPANRKLPQPRDGRIPTKPSPHADNATRAPSNRALAIQADEPNGTSLAGRLRYLFDSTRQRDGSRWTLNAVARASEGRLSAQAVYSLYTGHSTNPMLETIRTLADVFGVEPEFFVRSSISVEHSEYAAAASVGAQTDPQIAYVSRSMKQLPPADKSLIVDFVRRLSAHLNPSDQNAPDSTDSAQLPAILEGSRKDLPST